MFKENQEWLESLKPGDQIACNFGDYKRPFYRIMTVHKVTPTGIIKTIIDDGRQFIFNPDGYERGKTYPLRSRLIIQPLTRQVMEQIEATQYIMNLNTMDIQKLPLKYLRKFNELYEEYKWETKWEDTDETI